MATFGAPKRNSIISMLAFLSLSAAGPALFTEGSNGNQVLAVAEKMEAAFEAIENYACEAEQVFYQIGVEDQRYRFRFYFKREKKIRVDFSHPYSWLTLLYREGEGEATVLPFRSLPALRFRFSIDNPRIKTLAGQRIDQTDMGYFINFILKNLRRVEQRGNEFHEDGEQVKFLLWAMDYINHRTLEKYRITLSKLYWLPVRIERYSLEGIPIEVTDIKNYRVNGRLEDGFFNP